MNAINIQPIPNEVLDQIASMDLDILKAYLVTLSRNIEVSDSTDALFDRYWSLSNVLRERTIQAELLK